MNQNQLVLLSYFPPMLWICVVEMRPSDHSSQTHSCWTFEPKRFETIFWESTPSECVSNILMDGISSLHLVRCFCKMPGMLVKFRHFTRPQLVVMFWNPYHLYLYHNPGRKRRLWPQCLNGDLDGFRCLESYTHFAMVFTHKTATTRTGLHPMHSLAMDLWILGSQEMIAPQFYGIDVITCSSIWYSCIFTIPHNSTIPCNCIQFHAYTPIHPYTHTHTYTYTSTYSYSYSYSYTYTYTHIHTHTHTYVHTPTYIYTHTYTYIYMHTHTRIHNTHIHCIHIHTHKCS